LKTVVVESTETGENTVTLHFEDGAALTIGTPYLKPESALQGGESAFLYAGARIGPEQYPALEYAAECWKAEKAALALIARAEQCFRALSRKLERKKYNPAVVQAVLDRLSGLNLVSDRRFAELWLKARIRGGANGPRKLRMLLRARGIDRETAEAALGASLTEDAEAALLRRCLDKAEKKGKQKGKNPGNSMNRKTAIRLFLKSEGFSAAAINQYIEQYVEE